MSEPPRKKTKLTETTKAHRYQSFTKRISRIKIDPVHTVQKSRLSDDHNDLSKSYFRSALDEWTELNLTATFTSFLNKVNPLSESLPQLIHHAETIHRVLLEHIERRDELALEPLLSLVAHLAHDLGRSFYKHFPSTVRTVAQVSLTIDDPAAIESCFTCLAWMFKYLSRILVQDLRPLLEIMIPYMSVRKEYVRRFTAESLAFLLRKAAIQYNKTSTPLTLAVTYLFDELKAKEKRAEADFYQVALMTLFCESTMGVDAQLHSSAKDMLTCALDVAYQTEPSVISIAAADVLEGTIVSLIHRTNAHGYRPVLELVVHGIQDRTKSAHGCKNLYVKLLLASTGTRKGSRVTTWDKIIAAFLALDGAMPLVDTAQESLLVRVSIYATILQYAPMNQLLPHIQTILDQITTNYTHTAFFCLCEMVANLGKDRFVDLLLPRLQQYITKHWQDEQQISYLILELVKKNVISPKAGASGYITLSRKWVDAMSAELKAASDRSDLQHTFHTFFQLMHAVQIPMAEESAANIASSLSSLVNSSLEQKHAHLTTNTRLTIGWAFESYLKLSPIDIQVLWSRCIHQRQEAFRLIPFLKAFSTLCGTINQMTFESADCGLCVPFLVDNMLSASTQLRTESLTILKQIGKLCSDAWLIGTSELLSEILAIPYLPSTARQIAMLVRKLPPRQAQVDAQSIYHRLIPFFAMSMLRHYYDQTRRDLCTALGQMAANGNAEDVIIGTVITWLQMPGTPEVLADSPSEDDANRKLSPFECSNLLMIQALSSGSYDRCTRAQEILQSRFEQAHQLHLPRTPVEGRSLALQVLSHMSDVAERRSRLLMPIFLSISDGKQNHHVPQSDESTSSHTISPEVDEQPWTLRDRKLFLELISKFVNPRVLYRSSELNKVLLESLTNGNPEIRKLALNTIFNWKDPSLRNYEDVLLRVAEEKTATTELALLLSNSEETGSIKAHDRSSVIPVLLRLIFGQLIGRSSDHGSQEAKRKSILRLLFRMAESEVVLFLEIAVGRLGEVALLDNVFPDHLLANDLVSQDQQYGFLRMMLSMMDALQSHFAPYGTKVVGPILYCTARACRQAYVVTGDPTSSVPTLVRNIRRTGIQCLTLLFELCPKVDWAPYMSIMFSEVISPRLPNFAIENAQGVSALLRLVSTWSKSEKLLSLFQKYDATLVAQLVSAISIAAVRDEVRLFVLEHIFHPIALLANGPTEAENQGAAILDANTEELLQALEIALHRQISKDVILSATRLIPLLAERLISTATASRLLDILIILLREPSQRVPPHIKGSLLQATNSLLNVSSDCLSADSQETLFSIIANFYNYFRDQPNRETLTQILLQLGRTSDGVLQALRLCGDLNANSSTHLDEVDFDKRLAAFNTINTLTPSVGDRKEWLPIVCNLLYFSRSADDFSIRSNAVNSLRRYTVEACQSESSDVQSIVRETLLPAFRKGTREDSEMVRADFVGLFGLLIKYLPSAEGLQDMKVLLVGDDDEASFFSNILHIQQHRRLRAIRRLLNEVEQGKIKAHNISDFFIPLLSKFIDEEGGDESAQGIKGQSMAAMSSLLKWVDWKAFRKIFRQYRQALDTGGRSEKDAIKLLNNGADALTSAMEARTSGLVASDTPPQLATTLPPDEDVWQELKTSFIPKLSKFTHHKEETEISLRIPAANVAVKLIKLLSPDEIPHLVAPVLLDISQILRSRTQESRDIARNTLAETVVLLGPSSVQFVLKELRTTLARGYQLHVLSFTMHTILLMSCPNHQSGDLDYCIEELVAVIMDDVFGAAGQEKENQDYISSMKEVKSNKSFDSMELLAKTTSVKALSKLVKPFQSLLTGNLTSKQVRHVDELFRRMGVGISHNPSATNQDLLVFAYELIQAFYKEKVQAQAPVMTNDQKNRQRFLIQLDPASKTTSSTSSSLLYKIARFALDIVRSTLLKNASLLTAQNVHGFLPVIGDALVSGQEDVKISAFRLLSAIIRLPLKELDDNSLLYMAEAVRVIKDCINTSDEISQAALKLVTSILRERRDVEVKHTDVAYLLHRTMPDLEEPDRQGVTFNFVKAVMTRRYELPEVYELVDKIAIMLVTSQAKNARDASRGVYVHFLLDYPQTKNRWTKQLKFLVKNLEYQHPEGRQSVMEAVHNLLQKLDDEATQELVSAFFAPVVLRMASDEHAQCREMAGALLSQLYRKADGTGMNSLLGPLRGWTSQTENIALMKLAMQAWSIYFEVDPVNAEAEVANVRSAIARVLSKESTDDEYWELQFHALGLLQKLIVAYPATVFTQKQHSIWSSICSMLVSPHKWIQITSTSLLGSFFRDCLAHGTDKAAISSTCGLKFDPDTLLVILRNSVKVLRRNEDSQDLADSTSRNLLFLGQHVATHGLKVTVKAQQSSQADPEDEDINTDDSDSSDIRSSDDETDMKSARTNSIPAIQYLFDQLTLILRREPTRYTALSFIPRLTTLQLLSALIPHVSLEFFTSSASASPSPATNLLVPLNYITSMDARTPRSIDSTFPATYEAYTSLAHSVLEAIQSKIGDSAYVNHMTEASRLTRERRQARRSKRAIERVAEPEKALRLKRKKVERKKDRKKVVRDLYRKGRRRDLGF